MKALESRLGGIPTRTLQDGFAPPRSLWTEPRGMRVAEMFVPGLDAAVAETAGCRTGAEQFSVMDVTYGERGEVRNVRLAADVGSPACREAAAILAVLEVAPVAALPPAERTDQVVSVFTRDALECERRLDRGQRARSAPGDGISEPKRVHSVKPAYPPELIAARIQGKVVVEAVIDGLGCISRAAVVARVHPELDIRALVAVSQWRYTPTLLNGEPVPVIMTATVQYFLQ